MTSIEIYNTSFRNRKLLLLLILCLSGMIMTAQKSLIRQAETYYNAEHFSKSLELIKQCRKLEKKPDLLLKKAICEYNLGNPRSSIKTLNQIVRLDRKIPGTYYYLGLAYIDLKQYQAAADYLKTYLDLASDDISQRHLEGLLGKLRQCEYGTRLSFSKQFAFVENMGPSVNTEYNEIRPIQSPNFQSKFYFSSNRDISSGGRRNKAGLRDDYLGHYYLDMYAVQLTNGNWTTVYPFNAIQNTSKHEILQGFNSDGQVMYYSKADANNESLGVILADTFGISNENKAFPNKLHAPVFSEIGDKDLYFFKDHILLFSSKRDGGYGGYDLYITVLENGIWLTPVNLGPSINTPYDETSPYLTKGGKELYYSSNREEGFGGFDIFKSTYDGSKFTTINLGIPINSPRNDIHIQLTADGTQAVFSSDRADGEGGYDLYLAYWKDQILDQLAYTESLPDFIITDQDSISISIDKTFSDHSTQTDKKDYVCQDIYYDPDQKILTPQNIVILQSLIEISTLYPELNFDLIAHTNANNLKSFDLFFGIKRAERVRDYLIQKGISSDRIKYASVGSSYPLIANRNTNIANQIHNRIDIRINNPDTNRLNIVYKYPAVATELRAINSESYFNGFNEIRYRIKIASTTQMFRGDILTMESPFIVIPENDKLNYYIGDFLTYEDALDFKQQLMQNPQTEIAIIQPFLMHNPLSTRDAYKLSDNYPSLNSYLNLGK